MFNETANKEYIKTQFAIDEEIRKLQDALAAHNEQAVNIHWGHVGDLKHTLAQVKELVEWMEGEE